LTSLALGTQNNWLWLLPSGPDQIDHVSMRGGPSSPIVLHAQLRLGCFSFRQQSFCVGAILRDTHFLTKIQDLAMSIKHVSDATFDQDVVAAPTPVLVDYWADWCGPCKMIAPILEEVGRDYEGKLQIAKVDVDANQAVAAKFGIRGIPTLMLFKNGVPVATKVGAVSKSQLTAFLDSHL
jgi:thioredoxin 1